MKTFLMHPDRDFDPQPAASKDALDFAQDLELGILLNAAAAGDRYLYDIMSAAVCEAWTNDLATIRYRQDILKDCLANAGVRQTVLRVGDGALRPGKELVFWGVRT
jgi:hypothetical protein